MTEVTFNYCIPYIKYKDKEDVKWDMKEFCEWVLKLKSKPNKRPNMSVDLPKDCLGTLEWRDSAFDSSNDLYYIRLQKLRSNNLPAFRTVGKDGEKLILKNNQYLGEYNLLVFDKSLNSIAVQHNTSGLSWGQIETCLSQMRRNWFNSEDTMNLDEKDPGSIELRVITDPEKIDEVTNDGIFRTIEITGANINGLAGKNVDSNILNQAMNLAQEIDGVTFSLRVGVSRAPKGKSLKKKPVKSLIKNVIKLHNENDSIGLKISSKEDEDDTLENVNVLLPKLSSHFELVDNSRQTLGAEYIYHGFIDDCYFNENEHAQANLRKII